MRKLIFLLLAIILSRANSFGQCLTNGTFANACTATVTLPGAYPCPTWTTACGAGWVRSHGTPQMNPYTYQVPDGTNTAIYAYAYCYIFSGSTDTLGEGMFTPFTFQQGTWYDIKIDFTTYLNAGVKPQTLSGYGYVLCKAANGLTQHAQDACEDNIPYNGGVVVQSIGSYLGITPPPVGSGQTINTTSFSFQANSSYSQFWIYPYGTSTEQYNMNLYRVEICPSCTANAVYTTGTLPTIVAGGTVTIGGGSPGSTVGPNPASTTTISAANAIYFEKGFEVSAIGSGSTVVKIVPCGTSGNTATTADAFDSLNILSADPPVVDAVTHSQTPGGQTGLTGDSASSIVVVYPTVSSGSFNISGPAAALLKSNIYVADQAGRICYSLYNASATTIQLDLSNLVNGLYFIQIRQGMNSTVKKIIINK